MQFAPRYETGPDLNARVRDALMVAPRIRTFVKEYVKSGSR